MLFALRSKLRAHAKRAARGERSEGGFEDVTKMVDDMFVIEGKEQEADDKKKPWCNTEFEGSDREDQPLDVQTALPDRRRNIAPR